MGSGKKGGPWEGREVWVEGKRVGEGSWRVGRVQCEEGMGMVGGERVGSGEGGGTVGERWKLGRMKITY